MLSNLPSCSSIKTRRSVEHSSSKQAQGEWCDATSNGLQINVFTLKFITFDLFLSMHLSYICVHRCRLRSLASRLLSCPCRHRLLSRTSTSWVCGGTPCKRHGCNSYTEWLYPRALASCKLQCPQALRWLGRYKPVSRGGTPKGDCKQVKQLSMVRDIDERFWRHFPKAFVDCGFVTSS